MTLRWPTLLLLLGGWRGQTTNKILALILWSNRISRQWIREPGHELAVGVLPLATVLACHDKQQAPPRALSSSVGTSHALEVSPGLWTDRER
jgi:hypothetical protein